MIRQLIKWKVSGIFVMSLILISGCQKDFNLEPAKHKTSSFSSFREAVNDRYIVVFSSDFSKQVKEQFVPGMKLKQKQAVVESKGADVLVDYRIPLENIRTTYGELLIGLTVQLSSKQLKDLKKDQRIAYIEPDIIYELDQTVPSPNHHRDWHDRGGENTDEPTTEQAIPWGIKRVGYSTYAGSNRAWVLDTGIDLDHEDLSVAGADCNGGSCSFVTWGPKPGQESPDDDHGHGTHVGGTIGANDNNIGVVGVAAGIELVAVKIFTKTGSAKLSDIISGMEYIGAHAQENDVANMSFGGGKSKALDDATIALANKKVYISIAAGNSSDDADNFSPARTGNMHAYIFTIAAMKEGDTWAGFSNYGNPVSYISPGVKVLSTTPNNNYDEYSGTSMSAPHIAGILLLNNGLIDDDGTVQGPDKLYPIGHTGTAILATVNTRYREIYIPAYMP